MTFAVCADLDQGSQRMAIKIYRAGKCAGNTRSGAKQEAANLQYAHQSLLRRKQNGAPRPLGDYSDFGALVTSKLSGRPLQSILVQPPLLPRVAANWTFGQEVV